MSGTTANLRRKFWIGITSALALAVIVTLVFASHRKSPLPPSGTPLPQSATSLPPKPHFEARPAIDPTFLVLVLMQSAPTGARIVRVSDNYLLGYTPETIEFHQSLKPERIRFEMQGYTSVTRDVSAASDSELTVDLEPIPAKDPHRARPLRN